jgi:hypothetical protein
MGIDKSELRSIIAARRVQARPFADMARAIATELGTRHGKKHGAWWKFHDADHDLRIAFDDYGNNVEVYIHKQRVLNVHLGDITGYYPGRHWETILRKHHGDAVRAIQAHLQKSTASDMKDIEKKWGIRPDEIGVGGRTKVAK